MLLDFVYRLSQVFLRGPGVAIPICRHKVSQVAQVAAQFTFAFDQMDRETLIGQGQCGSHTGRTAADDQRGVIDRHFGDLQWIRASLPSLSPCAPMTLL